MALALSSRPPRSPALPRLAALAATLAVGCSGADPSGPRLADLELGLRGLSRAVAVSQTFTRMSTFEKASMPDSVAVALERRFGELAPTCGHTTRTGPQVVWTLDPGCVVAEVGLAASCTVTADVARDAETRIALTLALTTDGAPLTGSLSVATPNAIDFTYTADLGFAAIHLASPRLRVSGAGATGILELDGQLRGPSGSWSLEATSVAQRFSGCYPSAGTVRLTGDGIDERFTFAATTPADGQVRVTRSGQTTPLALPPRPGCPSG